LLETKVDTLGSKFPYILKNGNTEYKEFTISGLLSYLSDEKEYFINEASLGLLPYNEKRKRT
jgi:hypothetical protein